MIFWADGWEAVWRASSCREMQPRSRIVLVSSGEVYGPMTFQPAREDLPGLPWQKMSSTGMICANCEHLLTPLRPIIIRIGRVLESLTLPRSLELGDEALLKFSVLSRKEAEDAAELALKRGKPGEIYNIARKEPKSALHLIQEGVSLVGKWTGPFPVLDCTKARKELGWML